MGFWPFRRGSHRRKSLGGAEIPRGEMHNAGTRRDPARHDGSELASAGPGRRRSRRDTKRMSSRDSKKLQRDPEKRRTYSFSPGRKDSIRVPTHDVDPPPVPPLPLNWKGKARAYTEGPDPNAQPPRPLRASTQPADNTQDWQRKPTLHKRSAQEMARRKSSKKRKEDHDRELEIKAMVAVMPPRPVEAPWSGKLRKRDSKKMRGGLNRDLEGPASDISLPTAESLNSSRSETSFKLSALDMLSPRPTIRYSESPRYAPGASVLVSERPEARMKTILERPPINEGTLNAKMRIDELADDLSASELRELMERDQKRKEKKMIAERIKMEQRIARRQERQRADEAIAARDGTPSPPIMDRGVLGREVVGLGIGTSALVTSSKRKNSIGSDSGRGKRPAETFRQESPTEGHHPYNDSHRSASLATENLTPASEHSDPIIETAQVGTVGKASVSPPLGPRGPRGPRGHNRGASSISQMMELNNQEPSTPLPAPVIPEARRSSEASSRAPSSWTSFFKLRARNKSRHGSTPSSFSNTSRDSMHGGAGPQIGYQPMRSTSNIPKRTMSKFREDLPELPMSPPDSRVQSPESGVVSDSVRPIRTGFLDKRGGNRASLDDPRTRYDTPTSGYRSIDAMRLRDETPTSGHGSDIPSPEPTAALSQSLASIDSEGSWLSGRRPSKRGSNRIPQHHFHDSSSSLNKKYKEFSESAEELGIAEDEYFSRLTPGPEEEYKIQRQSTGNPMPSSDEEDGGSIATSPVASEKTKWGAVARHPTVVHREPRATSREGLLNDFDADLISEVVGPNASDSTREFIATGVQRARSVDLGKGHARHISAGSARLLDLKPRPSGDASRVSKELS